MSATLDEDGTSSAKAKNATPHPDPPNLLPLLFR